MTPSTESSAPPAVIPITKAASARAPTGTGERWLLALMAIFLLHVIIFGAGGIVEAVSRRIDQPWRVLPHDQMTLVFGSFLMAQCSLAAMAFGRSRLASHWKAIFIAVITGGIWFALQFTLSGNDFSDSLPGSWLLSLVTQSYLVACGVFALQRFAASDTAGRRPQYTILILLVWTTLVAVFLGCLRGLAQAFGVNLDLRTWEYFYALQAVGIFSAILAVLLWMIVQRCKSWLITAVYAGLAAVATTTVFVVGMRRCFADPGASALEMCWVMGGQALFLLAVLIPLRAALQPRALELPPFETAHHSTENSATTG